jgi:hypothetical protein
MRRLDESFDSSVARLHAGPKTPSLESNMNTLAQLQESMARLGTLLDDVEEIIEEPDGDAWSIEFTSGDILEVEFDEAGQRIAFSMVLGTPPPEHRAHTCEMLLTFNLLWQEDVPVRMAVGAPGEEVVQVAEFDLATMQPEDLPRHAIDFAAVADQWREHVLSGFQLDEAIPSLRMEHIGAVRA